MAGQLLLQYRRVGSERWTDSGDRTYTELTRKSASDRVAQLNRWSPGWEWRVWPPPPPPISLPTSSREPKPVDPVAAFLHRMDD